MKKLLLLLALVALTWYGARNTQVTEKPVVSASAFVAQVSPSFGNQDNGTQISGSGEVIRILSDDTNGSQHQRFTLQLTSGQMILVAHNIDIAPRVSDLRSGDRVAFHGEYVWNEQGGLIHWTHKDPDGQQRGGWLEHNGVRYE